MLYILSKYFKTGLLAAFASVLIILAELSRVACLSNECSRFGFTYSVCFSVFYFVFWLCVTYSVCVFLAVQDSSIGDLVSQ